MGNKRIYSVKIEYWVPGAGFVASERRETFTEGNKLTAEDYLKINAFDLCSAPYSGVQITLIDEDTKEKSTYFRDLRI